MDYDDYDHHEEDFDDYDYDDAADDWEAEAAQEEEDMKAEEARRAAQAEKKLGTRVPVKKEEVEEEVLPDDVQKEVDAMRQIANDIAGGEGIVKDSSVELLADKPVGTEAQAGELGTLIAEHLLTFAGSANFKVVMDSFFENLGKEFCTTKCINERTAKISIASEEFKRRQKDQKKRKDVSVKQNDQLDFGAVEDKGGATTEVDETPW